jgi:hypothetical protein
VLSITTHHHLCFNERHVPSTITSLSHVVFTKGAPPCYQSQLIIMLGFNEARPPCYQSQLIIMLCFHERCYVPHHVVFSRKARPSVLSITTHHHVVSERSTSLLHNSSSCCVFTKGTSSVLSITIITCYVFTKGARPFRINHKLSCCFTKARPSVLSITLNHVGFFFRHVLRAINHNLITLKLERGTSLCASIITSS